MIGAISSHYVVSGGGGGGGASYFDTIMARSPVVYYRHGEAAGSTVLTDSSGHGYNGSDAGTRVTGLLVGDTDGASDLNGTNQNVIMNNATALAAMDTSTFTWSQRIERDNTARLEALAARERSTARSWKVYIGSDDKLRCKVWVSGTAYEAVGATSLAANTPYSIAGRYNGSVVSVFVNGVVDGSVAVTGTMQAGGSVAWLSIGFTYLSSTSVNDRFDGTVDESAFIGSAVSDADLLAIHNAAIGA